MTKRSFEGEAGAFFPDGSDVLAKLRLARYFAKLDFTEIALAIGSLSPEKLQQSTVRLLCVCPGYAVRPILYHQQAGSLDRLGGPESRGGNATFLAPASSASVFSASRPTKKVASVAVT